MDKADLLLTWPYYSVVTATLWILSSAEVYRQVFGFTGNIFIWIGSAHFLCVCTASTYTRGIVATIQFRKM